MYITYLTRVYLMPSLVGSMVKHLVFFTRVVTKGQLISKCLWCLQFPPKNEQNQVNLKQNWFVHFSRKLRLEKIISTFYDH